jgi:hypothetical protein
MLFGFDIGAAADDKEHVGRPLEANDGVTRKYN